MNKLHSRPAVSCFQSAVAVAGAGRVAAAAPCICCSGWFAVVAWQWCSAQQLTEAATAGGLRQLRRCTAVHAQLAQQSGLPSSCSKHSQPFRSGGTGNSHCCGFQIVALGGALHSTWDSLVWNCLRKQTTSSISIGILIDDSEWSCKDMQHSLNKFD